MQACGGLLCVPDSWGDGAQGSMVHPHGASTSFRQEEIDESKANALSNLFRGQWSVETAVLRGACHRDVGTAGTEPSSCPTQSPEEGRHNSAGY